MNFIVLLFLSSFSLVQSTLKEEGAYFSIKAHPDAAAELEACESIDELFLAADLNKCRSDFVEGAATSLFESSPCRVIFVPLGKGVSNAPIPLSALLYYTVFQSIFGNKVHLELDVLHGMSSAGLHCGKKSEACQSLIRRMPDLIFGSPRPLKLCSEKWHHHYIVKEPETIVLKIPGKPDVVLYDLELIMRSLLPHMKKSEKWRPVKIKYDYERGQLAVWGSNGKKFVVKANDYIPHGLLLSIAETDLTQIKSDFEYWPEDLTTRPPVIPMEYVSAPNSAYKKHWASAAKNWMALRGAKVKRFFSKVKERAVSIRKQPYQVLVNEE